MVRVSADTQKINKFFTAVAKPQENNDDKDTDHGVRVKNNTDGVLERVQNIVESEEDTQPQVAEAIQPFADQAEENSQPAEESLIEEPSERLNNMTEKWKTHTALDQANITHIDPKESFKTRTFQYERVETKLTSVKKLRMDIESSCNMKLREVLANLIFIGSVSLNQSLIQYSTKLYLCDTLMLM